METERILFRKCVVMLEGERVLERSNFMLHSDLRQLYEMLAEELGVNILKH